MIGWSFYPDTDAMTSGSKPSQYPITEPSRAFSTLNRD
jgi:hypothetical protein